MADYKYDRKGDEVKEAIESVISKTVYNTATSTAMGLMSSQDKKKLDSIEDDQPITNTEIDMLWNQL